MKKWFPHYTMLIPALLIFILFHVIQLVDPRFKSYVKRTQKSQDAQTNNAALSSSESSETDSNTDSVNADIHLEKLKQSLIEIMESLPHPFGSMHVEKILLKPLEFLRDLQIVYKHSSKDQLLIVDKQHSLDAAYVPSDLVSLNDYSNELLLNKDTLQVSQSIIDDLLSMHSKANLGSIVLDISSAYRSYDYQENVFNYYVGEMGKEKASRVSARAGTSQHQLGSTLDYGCICKAFASTPAGQWLAENAWQFGFSLSYPPNMEHITGYSYESWHYRHIGLAASSFEHKYFNTQGQQYMLELLAEESKLQILIEAYL